VISNEPAHQKYRNNAVVVMSQRKTQELGWKKLPLMNVTSLCDKRNSCEEDDFVSVFIANQINKKSFYRSRCWPILIHC